MTKATIYLAGVGLAALMVSSAASADADTFGNKPEDRFDGFYVGAEAGALFAPDVDWHTGFQYSGIIGYRWQQPSNWVFGLEGTFGNPEHPLRDGSILDRRYSYDWSGVATVGYAFGHGNRSLLFAKAGWSGVRSSSALFRVAPDGSGGSNLEPTGERGHRSEDGLRLGVGYEHALSDNMSLRLSADYSNFDTVPSMVKSSIGVIFKF